MIRTLVVAILLLLGVIVWQRGSVSIAHRAADQAASSRDAMEIERDAARAEADAAAKTLKAERGSAAAANNLASKYEKEKNDAQKASDRLIADLRAGNQRLHQRWQASIATAELSAAAAAASQSDGRADDRIESAGRVVGAAAQCDAQVRGLQAYALLCSGGAR
ncbi:MULTISPECIES: endopeptidase [Stenotrophomonas]|uniref:endopeptidase n=1 Tax=Stenotrophomonas TaxID=40323 RepID=UPI001312C4C1|nr:MULTISPECIES: endopeptidase [Stenotrophomonas]MBA0430611.1 endopeptidase [Stenotrophomonas maltophilia]MBH1459606.1 endopeptidase [Stenotrophomonas maltophilia]MDH0274835.1 endopeptidase [Stenotrophomonas sp. GD04089]MDH1913318.1 endopeptidase [Stenotrophomonas sp. GD03794]HEL4242632.1 endopeptidase [Stenotrophomonas maltophilia]